MTEGPQTVAQNFELSDLLWDRPAQSRERLVGLRTLAGIPGHARGKPVPAKHMLRILGDLVHHLFPDDTTEELEQTARTLDPRLKAYLAYMSADAIAALEGVIRQQPDRLLGVPPGSRATYSNLISKGWIPWQDGWKGRLRS